MSGKSVRKEREQVVKDAKQRLESLHKKFYSPEKKPQGDDPSPAFHDIILGMHYEMGEKVKFIGCCDYMDETPLDPISGLHTEGFTTAEQHIKEINGHYRGKRCVILNISEKTTDDLTYFKVQFPDGIIMYPLPFEIAKLHSKIDSICQTCFSKAIGKCPGSKHL